MGKAYEPSHTFEPLACKGTEVYSMKTIPAVDHLYFLLLTKIKYLTIAL